MKINKGKILKSLNSIKGLRDGITDEQALANPDVYPLWNGEGRDYVVDERLLYNDVLYKVLQAHTSQSTWTPESAPSLFAKIIGGQGGTDVKEWQQPDSTNPYNKGDRCIFNGNIYESVINNNTWSPEAYPQGWKLISE